MTLGLTRVRVMQILTKSTCESAPDVASPDSRSRILNGCSMAFTRLFETLMTNDWSQSTTVNAMGSCSPGANIVAPVGPLVSCAWPDPQLSASWSIRAWPCIGWPHSEQSQTGKEEFCKSLQSPCCLRAVSSKSNSCDSNNDVSHTSSTSNALSDTGVAAQGH